MNIPSALVSSSDTLVEGRVPVETNTVAADEVECRILLLLTVLAGFGYGSGCSHISNQGRFHAIHRLAVSAMLAIGPEDSNHDRFYSKCGAVRQPIDAPCFLGFKHLNFGLRGTDYTVIHCSLQVFSARACDSHRRFRHICDDFVAEG